MILTLKNILESKNKKVVAFIVIAIATAVFLYSRYIMLGIDSDLVTEFIFVFFIVYLLLLGATYYFKNPLNPINFYTLFILCYGFNFLKLSTVSKTLSSTTHLVIILSIVFFVFGVLFGNKIKTEQKVLMNRQSKATIFYVTFVCIVLTFLLEIKTFGYLPLLKMFSMDVYKDTNDKLLSFLHYFIIIAAIIPSWAYILYRKRLFRKRLLSGFLLGHCLS